MEQDTDKQILSIFNFSEKRIFIIKILVGLLLFAAYVNSLLPQYKQGYNASLIDKINRLESIEEPKIVLIGNSNLAFGIDSSLLEAEMGMPVVNMGLHSGVGDIFHEEMAKLNVTPGDIYIICHSNYNKRYGDMELIWITIENNFRLWRLLLFSDMKEMVKSLPVYLKKSLKLVSSGTGNQIPASIYARRSFNRWGDIDPFRRGFYIKEDGLGFVPSIDNSTIERINELNVYLMSKGATLLVAGYPIRNSNITAKKLEEYIDFQETLKKKLDCPLISNYLDYMFDYRYFFDTNWHLTSEGAKLRTMQLISDLRYWIDSDSENFTRNSEHVDIISDVRLPSIDDLYEYLETLKVAKNRYTIFISFLNNESLMLNGELREDLNELGLSFDKYEKNYNYAAVIENGVVIQELMQDGKVEISGLFDDGKMTYSITSDEQNKEVGSSVLLNLEECSENVSGLNLVIYSNELHRKLDEVGFECSLSEVKAHRFSMQ